MAEIACLYRSSTLSAPANFALSNFLMAVRIALIWEALRAAAFSLTRTRSIADLIIGISISPPYLLVSVDQNFQHLSLYRIMPCNAIGIPEWKKKTCNCQGSLVY